MSEVAPTGRAIRVAPWLAGLVAFAAIAALSLWSAREGRYAGWFSDSVDYLIIADFYRDALADAAPPAASASYRTTRFPPLYPLILALAGGGPDDERAAFVATALLWVAALAMVWLWLARVAGVRASPFLALAVVACPGLFMLRLGLFSESLFVLLAFLALWMCERRKPLDFSHALVLALVAGISPLARSIGIALVAAVALHLACAPGLTRARKLAAIALCAVPFLAWTAYRGLLPTSGSYTQSLTLSRVLAGFGGVEEWLIGQPLRIVDSAIALWAPTGPGASRWLVVVLLVFAAVGLFQRLRRLAPDSAYLLASLAILFVWPFPAELGRMLAPLAPIVAWSALCGALTLWQRVRPGVAPDGPGATAIAAGVALGFVLAATPMWQRIVARIAQPVSSDLIGFRHLATYFVPANDTWAYKALEVNARVLATAREAGTAVPPGSRICTIVPGFLWLYSRQPAADLAHGLATPEQAEPTLRNCRYLFLIGATSPQHNDPPMYPIGLIEPERLRPLLLARYLYRGEEGVAAGLVELLPRDPRAPAEPGPQPEG